MSKFLSLIFAAAMFLPTDVTFACMENGARLYALENGRYREIAELPPSYYVAVLKDEEDGYALVSYLDVVGYVKADELKKVDFVPKDRHSKATFVVDNDSQPANLRSLPDSKTGNIVCVLPSAASGSVIGHIEGSELISGAGKRWYYVRYDDGDKGVYGYVYSAHIRKVEYGKSSGEREPQSESGTETQQGRPVSEMSLPVKIVLIVSLCLPVVGAMFMLRPKKREARQK